MKRPLLVAAALLIPASADAAKVKTWQQHAPAHYDKARFHNAVVSSEGGLRLARQLKPLAALEAMHVWDVVEDRAGNLFVATGDEGKIYKVTPEGKVSVAWAGADPQILCLALAPDGSVYAGTGPGGRVVCVPPSGKPRVVAEGLDSYVWCLSFDEETKTLFAGTGPKGRIWQVPHDGKATVFYKTRQDHVLCLARAAGGPLYAGTDKGGLIYRIDRAGKGFVLHQVTQGEVRSLLVTADGVFAGTSSPVSRGSGGGSSGGSERSAARTAGTSGGAKPVSNPPKIDRDVIQAGAAANSTSDRKDEPKSKPAAAPSAPAAGENSLYRIAADGTVRELFRERVLMLSLLRKGGRVLVGTGMQGQLFEIDEATRERVELARLDHGQIHCLCRRRDGSIVVGAGDPAKLYTLQERYAARGLVVSEVLDAKIVSKWGTMSWKAATPEGTRATVAVRSGNVAEPDDTWSEWSAEQSDPEQARAAAPAARFLQYRVTLTSDNPLSTPVFRGLAVRYATTNQAPEITAVEVPDLDSGNLDKPKKLKLKWSATDANEDELTYSLHVRKDGWKNWVQIEESLSKREYEWDTSGIPSGVYRVKVVASDARDNAAEDAQTAEKVSDPFPVAHAPPSVSVKVSGVDGDRAVIEAVAVDPLVRLTEASFAVNGKAWSPVFPADGLFDSRSETFRFRTEALRPGTYVLVLRVRDAAGNVGSGDVVFTVQPRAAGR